MAKRIKLSKQEKLFILSQPEDNSSNDSLFENSLIPLLKNYEYKIQERENKLKSLGDLMDSTNSPKGLIALRDLMLKEVSEISKMEEILFEAKLNEEKALKKVEDFFNEDSLDSYTFSRPLKK
ncbi:Oidioi.mRNA.OKI2018_I69.chr2.g5112.t1.cds [Oikopleura dioica]|uniref:Oidioi.mRNA.OKI2018_I69.chr2.g5112.t1.cds n=1 Tax=Oikopleura dioica TaxID=34765 RepID=A0ABN7T8K4_OIKDI|nr:Oidioi.mRNA.OKI2018_I69.chr2.g5112.t1.cds [Oikopleura dioica]